MQRPEAAGGRDAPAPALEPPDVIRYSTGCG